MVDVDLTFQEHFLRRNDAWSNALRPQTYRPSVYHPYIQHAPAYINKFLFTKKKEKPSTPLKFT